MVKGKKRSHCSGAGPSSNHIGGHRTAFMVNQVIEEKMKVNPLSAASMTLNTEIHSNANDYPKENLYYLTHVFKSTGDLEAEEEKMKRREEKDTEEDYEDEEDQEMAEDVQIDLRRLEDMKILMSVAHDDIDLGDNMNVSLYLSILIRVSNKLRINLTRPLKDLGFLIKDIKFDNWCVMAGIQPDQYRDIEKFDSLVTSHISALTGIFMVLIGKKLMTENYESWMEKRVVSFGRSCGIVTTEDLIDLTPSQEVCLSVYTYVSPKHDIRKIIFNTSSSLASYKGQFYHTAQTSMRLLRGAEIGNLSLCMKYIVLENPILLAWQELANYSPTLIAAVKKYQSLGESAAYAKFICKPEDLREFSSESITMMAHIARAIAINEVASSFQNFKGTDTARINDRVLARALEIVSASGGANTRDTASMRHALLAPEGNDKILNLLQRSAEDELGDDSCSDSEGDSD